VGFFFVLVFFFFFFVFVFFFSVFFFVFFFFVFLQHLLARNRTFVFVLALVVARVCFARSLAVMFVRAVGLAFAGSPSRVIERAKQCEVNAARVDTA
jgi:hypothetical protein